MKQFAMAVLVTAFVFAAGTLPSKAQSNMSSSSSNSMMAMPKCASGDSVVGVNMTTKTYMTQAQMKTKMAGMSMAQQQAMMKKNNVKLMCKTQAMSMGAKMMTSPPM